MHEVTAVQIAILPRIRGRQYHHDNKKMTNNIKLGAQHGLNEGAARAWEDCRLAETESQKRTNTVCHGGITFAPWHRQVIRDHSICYFLKINLYGQGRLFNPVLAIDRSIA